MPQVLGYRELNDGEIVAMNRVKACVEALRDEVESLKGSDSFDQRCVALAITKLEECSMWACRAIARPTAG